MTLDNEQLQMLLSIFWWQMAVATLFGMFVSAFINAVFKKILVRFNRPKTIKTMGEILYRADNGFYVPKSMLEKLNAEFMFKNKQRHISVLKRRIHLLEQSLKQSDLG